ncbi:SMI1/KNR4 family protein [Chryseobacterium sp.]|uniref:SMI1/KNR4 family protein n=1 Tax=Chryseobacterium sp. TaxID=1871047 RepID=UPI0025C3FE40|nr:SMI1/KNR4 family protein [Chryseobacterium sp.]MBV8328033.1 SMI1/KNR4 family protein [Chryseobacterium sp.]
MIRQTIISRLSELTEGRLTAEEWAGWFRDHTDQLEKICGRLAFLKIKPKDSFSGIRNLYIGQLGAFEWLESQKINVHFSDLYQKRWEKEFADFCKAEKEKEQWLRKIVENKFEYLKNVYPKFFRQLTKSYSDSDIIEAGISSKDIQHKEKELSIQLPADLILFYKNISKLKLEGIEIDFSDLSHQIVQKVPYLILGEFWMYGDGDQLLYHWESQHVYIFAHDHQPPKVIEIADSITDLVEKKMVAYLKNYETA